MAEGLDGPKPSGDQTLAELLNSIENLSEDQQDTRITRWLGATMTTAKLAAAEQGLEDLGKLLFPEKATHFSIKWATRLLRSSLVDALVGIATHTIAHISLEIGAGFLLYRIVHDTRWRPPSARSALPHGCASKAAEILHHLIRQPKAQSYRAFSWALMANVACICRDQHLTYSGWAGQISGVCEIISAISSEDMSKYVDADVLFSRALRRFCKIIEDPG
eukprot:TRINITY_DN6599_c0_g1_i1.p1 TRINITY_DN6599_c0_g1~~TRINITY_DN6599_c0_g1_i1.p1  ORF type:complete len:220 (-),score=14.29 TRINITY_DN6599_c0_g1_i1:135-794(-)